LAQGNTNKALSILKVGRQARNWITPAPIKSMLQATKAWFQM
jgi:hypothetical protein